MLAEEAIRKLHDIFEILIGDCADEWTSQKHLGSYESDNLWAKHLLTVHKKSCQDADCTINNCSLHASSEPDMDLSMKKRPSENNNEISDTSDELYLKRLHDHFSPPSTNETIESTAIDSDEMLLDLTKEKAEQAVPVNCFKDQALNDDQNDTETLPINLTNDVSKQTLISALFSKPMSTHNGPSYVPNPSTKSWHSPEKDNNIPSITSSPPSGLSSKPETCLDLTTAQNHQEMDLTMNKHDSKSNVVKTDTQHHNGSSMDNVIREESQERISVSPINPRKSRRKNKHPTSIREMIQDDDFMDGVREFKIQRMDDSQKSNRSDDALRSAYHDFIMKDEEDYFDMDEEEDGYYENTSLSNSQSFDECSTDTPSPVVSHTGDENLVIASPTPFTYNCLICEEVFEKREHLRRHLEYHVMCDKKPGKHDAKSNSIAVSVSKSSTVVDNNNVELYCPPLPSNTKYAMSSSNSTRSDQDLISLKVLRWGQKIKDSKTDVLKTDETFKSARVDTIKLKDKIRKTVDDLQLSLRKPALVDKLDSKVVKKPSGKTISVGTQSRFKLPQAKVDSSSRASSNSKVDLLIHDTNVSGTLSSIKQSSTGHASTVSYQPDFRSISQEKLTTFQQFGADNKTVGKGASSTIENAVSLSYFNKLSYRSKKRKTNSRGVSDELHSTTLISEDIGDIPVKVSTIGINVSQIYNEKVEPKSFVFTDRPLATLMDTSIPVKHNCSKGKENISSFQKSAAIDSIVHDFDQKEEQKFSPDIKRGCKVVGISKKSRWKSTELLPLKDISKYSNMLQTHKTQSVSTRTIRAILNEGRTKPSSTITRESYIKDNSTMSEKKSHPMALTHEEIKANVMCNDTNVSKKEVFPCVQSVSSHICESKYDVSSVKPELHDGTNNDLYTVPANATKRKRYVDSAHLGIPKDYEFLPISKAKCSSTSTSTFSEEKMEGKQLHVSAAQHISEPQHISPSPGYLPVGSDEKQQGVPLSLMKPKKYPTCARDFSASLTRKVKDHDNHDHLLHSQTKSMKQKCTIKPVNLLAGTTGDTIMHCMFCPRKFTNSQDFDSHKQDCAGKKKFKCYRCGRCFYSDSALERHLEAHPERQPLSCNICHDSFSSYLLLKCHIANAHNIYFDIKHKAIQM